MALSWSIQDVRNSQDLFTDHEADITESLVFSTMAVGMPTITEDNWREFATRLHMLAIIHGREPFASAADVRRRIGLRTNASLLTPAKFRTHAGALLRTEAEARVGNGLRAAAE